MKPLILILLLAISVEAQTIADVARQERERRARLSNIPVIAAEGARNATTVNTQPAADQKPASTDKNTPAPAAAGSAPTPARVSSTDPVKEWTERVEKLRKKIQELQDEETALQLQVNQLTNQFFAPVTDQLSKDQAQARLGETQNRLTAVQAELDQTKKTLDAMQLQGPPKG